MPDTRHPAPGAWLEVLRERAEATGQRAVARLMGYSPSVVSQVLAGSYGGDLTAVRRAVEGAFMAGLVECPALGQEIGTQDCLRFQRMPLAASSPARVRLHRTCPTCPHNRQRERGEAA
jgi:DNA-binding transcriptional regulator YdaS (Cro superfamily)